MLFTDLAQFIGDGVSNRPTPNSHILSDANYFGRAGSIFHYRVSVVGAIDGKRLQI
jgi:hypothetical protein